ncbi:hypothetical protein F5J12DRAFT_957252 [Pisolithus orientalis]|uniref:uncharacterized protein n=1 Tax=Pisolithus orientalis TaxID=936130 RepID=UPI0022252776|nr:uncharacterized protein F5J12DRAFT_957252 [Pisolithus orientalis]KAI5997328.1 hypothetical protein F5J12DRAFT_957252 [Pisolithus orientalis]
MRGRHDYFSAAVYHDPSRTSPIRMYCSKGLRWCRGAWERLAVGRYFDGEESGGRLPGLFPLLAKEKRARGPDLPWTVASGKRRLMGPAGSAKTNMSGRNVVLTRTKEERATHQLKSHTQGVREFTVNLSKDRQYLLVDTPGFDDTYRSDRDILHTTVEWLEKKYRGNVKLRGIIYTGRITGSRMSGSV